MNPIITQPGLPAHVLADAAVRQRRYRLAKATADQMESALAFLSLIDPEAFEIAMTAVTPPADAPDDDEPVPVCRACGALVGIFLNHGLAWQHFRGDATTSGAQHIYDPGHPA